ncbi:bifunctional DNA primase/polymerase [Actinokineospora soli]|uniref:Bifunctional DNA primase/polymerase n=1 Tax=Actinokineospora soli TaxID=1048753 RepID=A0ABW2TI55_9PSEU
MLDSSERSDTWRRAFRPELRAEAIGLAFQGWSVLPGTYPTANGWFGRDGMEADGPRPVHADWQDRIGTDAEQVATWWAGKPYSLLLATGAGVDAIEVDGDLGRRAARVLRTLGFPVPIAATPESRWLFFTRSGGTLHHDLSDHDVTLRAEGDWIALPPSPVQHGVVHWRVKPEVCSWVLPPSRFVQDALLEAVDAPESTLVSAFVAAD